MPTTGVNAQIANASARSVSSAVTYVNSRDAAISASTFGSAKTYADATFLTKASAGTMYSTLSNNVTNVNNSLTAFSATVVNTYATENEASEFAATALGNAMAYTDSKIQGIGIGDYLTKASAGTMYNNITSKFDNYALSASVNTRLAATSASSVSSSVTYTNSRDAAISASTFSSAKTYADATFLTKASAGTMYSNVTSQFSNYTPTTGMNTQIANASARSVSSAVTYVNGRDATLSASTFASAKTYADATFLTKASAGTMYSTLSNNVTNVNNSLTAFSATVINNYATDAKASSYAAAALANSMDYTDSKIQAIGIGDYLTRASAGTMYANITSKFDNYALSSVVNTQIANASARTYAAASAYTNTQDASLSAKTFASAKTYADATFLTKASAGTMYSNVTNSVSTLSSSTVSLSAAVNTKLSTVYSYQGSVASCANLPATGKVNGYVYNVVAASGNTPAGTNYAWNGSDWDALGGTVDLTGYLTKASAGTMYSTLANQIENVTTSLGDYALSAAVNDVIAVVEEGQEVTAAALTDLDNRIRQISSVAGDYLTKASAGTMYSNITSTLSGYATKDDLANSSASSVASAVTYVNDRDATMSASTFASAKTYADATFLTRASAGTMYSNLTSSLGNYVAKTGDTMTGVLTMKANMYEDAYNGALNMNNSDIYGLNSIYTADKSDNPAEGIHFWRSATSVDTLRAVDGVLKFFPNRTVGSTAGTEYNIYHTGNLSPVTLNTDQTIASAKTFTKAITANGGVVVQTAATFTSAWRGVPFSTTDSPYNNIRYVNTNANSGLTYNPFTGKLRAYGFVINGKAATDLLTADGGVTTVATVTGSCVPTTRKVNGHALSADVTVTKGDLSLGNVENTALSTWTGNTSIKSVGTITAGTWNGTKIGLAYLAQSAITIDGTLTGLGGSVTTSDKKVGQASSTAAERRALILGTTTAATGTALGTTAVTGETAYNKDIYAIPSTGELNSKQVRINEKVTLQYNSTTESLDFIFS